MNESEIKIDGFDLAHLLQHPDSCDGAILRDAKFWPTVTEILVYGRVLLILKCL